MRLAQTAAEVDEEVAAAFDGLTTGDWVRAGLIVVVAFLVAAIVRRLASRFVDDEEGGRTVAVFIGRVVAALVVVGGLVYALNALGVRLAPLLGALGIGGLALAFAAQQILANVFASILLQARHPFRRGDQISTDEIEGTVEDVNLRAVVLRTYDGERVYVPCSQVLENPIVNHTTRGVRRTSVEVGVAYAADLEAVRRGLITAVAQVEGVRERPGTEVWVEAFGESSIDLVVRYWHDPDIATTWRVRSEVAITIKRTLDELGVEIPFPQRVVTLARDRVEERS